MRPNTPLTFGEAPTPEELEAAIRRGRALQSAAFHNAFKRAREGAAQAGDQLRGSMSMSQFMPLRRTPAPMRRATDSLWSMLPRLPRWQTITRDRVL